MGLALMCQAKIKTESHRLTSSSDQEATGVCSYVRTKDGFLQSPAPPAVLCSFQTHNTFGMAEEDDEQTLRTIILSEVALDHFFKTRILFSLLFI